MTPTAELFECVGGPWDGQHVAAYDDDEDAISGDGGFYLRRAYRQVFIRECAADPLLRLLPDVFVWVPFRGTENV